MKPAMIVDDDAPTRRVLELLAGRMGLEAQGFASPVEALERLRTERFAVVLTDLRMPEMSGIEFMRALRELDPDVPVIVLTAYGTVEAAVEAMKLGALDFVSKPLDADVVEALVGRALEHARRRAENQYLREGRAGGATIDSIVGESEPMRAVFDVVHRVAPANSSVLITGETGTGKELVAQAIHRLSPRAAKLFVPLNCSAIPAELLAPPARSPAPAALEFGCLAAVSGQRKNLCGVEGKLGSLGGAPLWRAVGEPEANREDLIKEGLFIPGAAWSCCCCWCPAAGSSLTACEA